MTTPVTAKIAFDRDKGPVSVQLMFRTMLLCTYRIDLREGADNRSVPPFPVVGDNTGDGPYRADLPGPAPDNDGRKIWITSTVTDQTGDRGEYTIAADVLQDGIVIGTVTTGKKKLDTEQQQEILVAFLSMKG